MWIFIRVYGSTNYPGSAAEASKQEFTTAHIFSDLASHIALIFTNKENKHVLQPEYIYVEGGSKLNRCNRKDFS